MKTLQQRERHLLSESLHQFRRANDLTRQAAKTYSKAESALSELANALAESSDKAGRLTVALEPPLISKIGNIEQVEMHFGVGEFSNFAEIRYITSERSYLLNSIRHCYR